MREGLSRISTALHPGYGAQPHTRKSPLRNPRAKSTIIAPTIEGRTTPVKRLVLLLVSVLVSRGGRRRRPGEISLAPDQGAGALRAGRRRRHRGAHRHRADAPAARPDLRDREQARRLWHPRHPGHGAGAARRLHDHVRQQQRQRHHADPLRQEVHHRLRPRRDPGGARRRRAGVPDRDEAGFPADEVSPSSSPMRSRTPASCVSAASASAASRSSTWRSCRAASASR